MYIYYQDIDEFRNYLSSLDLCSTMPEVVRSYLVDLEVYEDFMIGKNYMQRAVVYFILPYDSDDKCDVEAYMKTFKMLLQVLNITAKSVIVENDLVIKVTLLHRNKEILYSTLEELFEKTDYLNVTREVYLVISSNSANSHITTKLVPTLYANKVNGFNNFYFHLTDDKYLLLLLLHKNIYDNIVIYTPEVDLNQVKIDLVKEGIYRSIEDLQSIVRIV